jgi:hypothetical protein
VGTIPPEFSWRAKIGSALAAMELGKIALDVATDGAFGTTAQTIGKVVQMGLNEADLIKNVVDNTKGVVDALKGGDLQGAYEKGQQLAGGVGQLTSKVNEARKTSVGKKKKTINMMFGMIVNSVGKKNPTLNKTKLKKYLKNIRRRKI